MIDDNLAVHPDETHEQFIKRAGSVFPAECVRAWSRVERAVFNHVMAQLIAQHSYASITNEMLRESRDNMEEIVRRLWGR